MTYVINKATKLKKNLLILYCNSSSYISTKSEFLQRGFFIKISSTKYLETN